MESRNLQGWQLHRLIAVVKPFLRFVDRVATRMHETGFSPEDALRLRVEHLRRAAREVAAELKRLDEARVFWEKPANRDRARIDRHTARGPL